MADRAVLQWIKQHLKIKKFLGESENSVRIQLLTGLIAYLLVILMKAASALGNAAATLKETLDELRTGLFQRPQEELSRYRRRRTERALMEAVQPGLFA